MFVYLFKSTSCQQQMLLRTKASTIAAKVHFCLSNLFATITSKNCQPISNKQLLNEPSTSFKLLTTNKPATDCFKMLRINKSATNFIQMLLKKCCQRAKVSRAHLKERESARARSTLKTTKTSTYCSNI